MSFQHLHEMMQNHPLVVESVQQVEVTIADSATTGSQNLGVPVVEGRSTACWGGFRPSGSGMTNSPNQYRPRINIKADGTALEAQTAAASTTGARICCASVIQWTPWFAKGKTTLNLTIPNNNSGASGSSAIAAALQGQMLPFWNGFTCNETNQNLENHWARLSALSLDGSGNLNWTLGMGGTPNEGDIITNLDVLWINSRAVIDGLLQNQARSPFAMAKVASWEPGFDFIINSGDIEHTSSTSTGNAVERMMHFPIGGTSGNFQTNLMRTSLEDNFGGARFKSTRGAAQSFSPFNGLWAVQMQPWFLRHRQAGFVTIPGNSDNEGEIALTGFTNFNKMAIIHHGSSTNNAFANIFGYATVKLIDKDNAVAKSGIGATNVQTDVAYEVWEFW